MLTAAGAFAGCGADAGRGGFVEEAAEGGGAFTAAGGARGVAAFCAFAAAGGANIALSECSCKSPARPRLQRTPTVREKKSCAYVNGC